MEPLSEVPWLLAVVATLLTTIIGAFSGTAFKMSLESKKERAKLETEVISKLRAIKVQYAIDLANLELQIRDIGDFIKCDYTTKFISDRLQIETVNICLNKLALILTDDDLLQTITQAHQDHVHINIRRNHIEANARQGIRSKFNEELDIAKFARDNTNRAIKDIEIYLNQKDNKQ